MHRLLSFCFIVIFLGSVVGVGFVFKIPSINIGEVGTFLRVEKAQRSYPLISAYLTSNESAASYDSMVFVGDVLLARNIEYLMRSNGNEYPFEGLNLTSLGANPAVIGNFEATVPIEHVPTPIGMINFSVSKTFLPQLKKSGYTHMSLANNHSFDFSEAGLNNTREELNKHVTTFGDPNDELVSEVSYIELSGQKIALIGLNALPSNNNAELQNLFTQTSKESDIQIVFIHWGEEYALRHNDFQTEFATMLIDFGADLIVGHHPHVTQGVDLINGVLVFYSLGNYIFDQYFSKDVQEGLVLSLNYNDGLSISLIPISSTLSQPKQMNSDKHGDFLDVLSRKSHPDLAEQIKTGHIKFDEDIETSDKVAMMLGIKKYVQ